jgi:hypothetical protein
MFAGYLQQINEHAVVSGDDLDQAAIVEWFCAFAEFIDHFGKDELSSASGMGEGIHGLLAIVVNILRLPEWSSRSNCLEVVRYVCNSLKVLSRTCEYDVLHQEESLDILLSICLHSEKLVETKAGRLCQVAALSALNNCVLGSSGGVLFSKLLQPPVHASACVDLGVQNGSRTRLGVLMSTAEQPCPIQYLIIIFNFFYRCAATSEDLFKHFLTKPAQRRDPHFVRISIMTLAWCIDRMKLDLPHSNKTKLVDLGLALFRLIFLFASKWNTLSSEQDAEGQRLETMLGLVLRDSFFLNDDRWMESRRLKHGAVMVLMEMPDKYLVYFARSKGVPPLCQLCYQETERFLLGPANSLLAGNAAETLAPLFLSLYKLAKADVAARQEMKSIIFPEQSMSAKEDRHGPFFSNEQKKNRKDIYKPSDAPEFTFRCHLINLLLKSSDGHITVPLGDYLFLLCDEDVDEFVGRVGLGYGAGLLQRRGLLGQLKRS